MGRQHGISHTALLNPLSGKLSISIQNLQKITQKHQLQHQAKQQKQKEETPAIII
jgi:hypothetical protein